MNWKEEIVKLVYIKQQIAERDIRHLWPHHLPGVAATRAEITTAEEALGFPLDARYKNFLHFANGWNGFYQSVDLFGTDDLVDSAHTSHVHKLTKAIDSAAWIEAGESIEHVLPIAATDVDLDIFLIAKSSARKPGSVIWFAGGHVETFPDFDEYFLAMADYNRAELRDLTN